jgi:redox-sensitive bicupin YhaK (pirin superfamily)
MTAGRGIVHAEMPATNDDNIGLQLWVNLPKKFKMIEPKYQELLDKNIPRVNLDNVEIKVIAGSTNGIDSPVFTATPIIYFHIKMKPHAVLEQVKISIDSN